MNNNSIIKTNDKEVRSRLAHSFGGDNKRRLEHHYSEETNQESPEPNVESNLKKSKTTEDVKIADQRLHRADSTTELAQTQNIEMANENQNYNEMIVYIEQHYMNSYNTTPRDRQEIFAHLPAWKELNAMREHRTGLRSTITLMEESIVMYFVVVTRGWKIALKTKEESLYERMGVLHAAERLNSSK